MAVAPQRQAERNDQRKELQLEALDVAEERVPARAKAYACRGGTEWSAATVERGFRYIIL